MKPGALTLLAFLGLYCLAPSALAQPVDRPVRLGILYLGTPYSGFVLEALRVLGYDQKKNLIVDERSASGWSERMPQLAAELISLKPDVLIGSGTPSVLALMKATSSTPIIMMDVGPVVTTDVDNPFSTGLVQSIARPGGNVTGFTNDSTRLLTKAAQLARELFPEVCCFLWLRNPANPANIAATPSLKEMAAKIGVETKIVDVATPAQFDQFMQAPLDERFKRVLLVQPDLTFYSRRTELGDYALQRRFAMFTTFRANGALLTYTHDGSEEARIIADFVDKILKGAKPADLPVQAPTKFVMIINLKTAKALGITIPPSIIGQATELVE